MNVTRQTSADVSFNTPSLIPFPLTPRLAHIYTPRAPPHRTWPHVAQHSRTHMLGWRGRNGDTDKKRGATLRQFDGKGMGEGRGARGWEGLGEWGVVRGGEAGRDDEPGNTSHPPNLRAN